jgi:hypothetical protein
MSIIICGGEHLQLVGGCIIKSVAIIIKRTLDLEL